ncbi:uncharacterized protein DCP2 [Eurosta solidaginis]|uniref:uncharacterized protein DCP2 n=1 Tax=Eurosta solidaginis TaxID=178769 RepID=UPI0035307738
MRVMEIALNSAIASSTQHATSTIDLGETFPTSSILDHNENICKEKFHVGKSNIIGDGHSILNLFATPAERCKDEVNALASLTLKNALNVNSGSKDKSHVNGKHKLLKGTVKSTKHNGSSEISQQQYNQHTSNHSQSSELLAALKITATKISTNDKKAKNKTNKSLNISTSSEPSSSSTSSIPSSLSATSSTSSVSTLPLLSASTLLSTSPPTSCTKATPSVATETTTNTIFTTSKVSTGTPVLLHSSSVTSCSGSGNACIKNGSQIPSDILDDLASRFIINVPDMELNNMIRICFQIELAHWFYLDFFCASAAAAADQKAVATEVNKKRKLPSCGIKQFAVQLFQHIPFLREHLTSIDKILDDWKNYKLAVPTFGAILISEDLNFCLLVQSYFAKCSWGFPKGKVNENEDPVHCATREVYEETGYDITNLIVPNDYIEAVINYQYTRLYIVRDVSLKTQFSPRTRNEIKCCDWFPIDSLPINKNDAISKAKLGLNANSFFMIMPFIKRLKRWVHDKRTGIDTRRKYSDGDTFSNIPTTLMAKAAVAAAAAIGCTQNSNNIQLNNQKQNNAYNNNNNSSKKIKQQHTVIKCDDKHNALNGGIGNTTNNGNKNNNSDSVTSSLITTTVASNENDNSKSSKRQRHKSMGDLDGIKLNNLSSNNCNTNMNSNTCKISSNIITTTALNIGLASTTMTCSSIESVNGVGASQKRIGGGCAVKLVAAGSNNNNGHNHNSVAGCMSSKRQLFHSQSQNSCNQYGEKIVSSFDLIRKEKQQQIKATAAVKTHDKASKSQRQQPLQSNVYSNSGRARAKSQSDKMCVQQQQPSSSQINNVNNDTNIGGNLNKYGIQKQQATTMVVSPNTVKSSNKDNILNNFNMNAANNKNTATNNAKIESNTSPTSGYELLAFAAEAATTFTSLTNSSSSVQQKQRPASVSLHFETMPIPAAGQLIQQKLQRMASGTNLRILKRSTSFQQQMQQNQQKQPTEARSMQQLQQPQHKSTLLQSSQQQLQNEQALQRQQQQQTSTDLKFKPSFNSWTNFSFTKNFIANVFC